MRSFNGVRRSTKRLLWAAAVIAAATNPEYDLTYSAVQTSSANANQFTFPAYNIGAANTNRMVVAAISFSDSTARTISSVTIGGVAATQIRTDATSTSLVRTYVFRASVPTGTTADVVVTIAAAATVAAGIACHVWHAGRINQTPLASSGGNAVSSAVITASNLQIASGGFVIAVGGSSSTATAFEAWTWNGVDVPAEHTDGLVNVGIQHLYSAISFKTTETDLTRDLTSDITGGNRHCMTCVSWA